MPLPSPRDLPNPGIEPWSPALQADSLPSEQPGKSSIFQIRTLLCPPTEACPFSPCLPTSAQVRPAPSFCPSPALSTASGYPRGQRGQSRTLVLPGPPGPEGPERDTSASGSPEARARAEEGPCAVYMLPLVAYAHILDSSSGILLWVR